MEGQVELERRKGKLFNVRLRPSWEAESNRTPRYLVTRSLRVLHSNVASLNGLVERNDGMELGPCHIGKNRGDTQYIDPIFAEAVPLKRELSRLGEPSLSWEVMSTSGAPRRTS